MYIKKRSECYPLKKRKMNLTSKAFFSYLFRKVSTRTPIETSPWGPQSEKKKYIYSSTELLVDYAPDAFIPESRPSYALT